MVTVFGSNNMDIVRPLSVSVYVACLSVCRLRVIVPVSEGELYIRRPQKASGPNLLEEPLKGFIVNPADIPW